jgi:hypothetical protein
MQADGWIDIISYYEYILFILCKEDIKTAQMKNENKI